VAFVESAEREDISDSLWEYARTELPRAAVPQDFIVVDALPVNANEKVDYVALELRATQRQSGHGDAAGLPAPADELVAGLVELWRQLLDRDDVTEESNFFTHGGHSLLGARLVQQIERTSV
jgi:hypothetical protein